MLVRRFALYCIFSLVALATPGFAQQLSSNVSGTVANEDGTPLPNVSVRWAQLGKTMSVLTDASGKFSFEFAEPGIRTLRFEHPSTSTAGTYAAMLHENISIDLSVVLHHEDASGIGDTWSIKQQYGKSPAIAFPERVISSESMNSQPTTESLWSFLNMTEPSVVADRFDISGLHSYRQLLLGVRGSSWTQNQGMVNGLSISNPTGDGLLAFPDLSTMESIIYSVGTSPTRHTGPGAHIQLIPKTGGQERHGEARISFQSGALQNTNVIARYRDFGLTESDERWKHFVNGGVQLGGPLGKSRWTYFTALSVRDAEKWVRNQDLPISGSVAQETFNTVGEWSPNDRFSFYSAMQQRREPQAEASPLVTRDSSVRQYQTYRQGQGVWTHSFSPREFLQVRGGASVTHLNSKFQTGATGQSQEDIFPGYVVDGIFPRLLRMGELYEMMVNTRRGPAPLITSYDSGVWEAAVSYSSEHQVLGIRHQLSSGANLNLASLKERDEAIDGVNLGFFYQAPYTVRLLSTPVKTHDRIRQLELYASDRFSLSRLSVIAGMSADVSEGVSILTTGRSTNDILWSNIGGNFGTAFQVTRRRPLIVRAAVARIFDQPTLNVWNGSNPQGLGTRTFLWDDVNGDRQFQPGENTQLLKVSGAPFTRVDPSLKNPMTSEITMGLMQGGLWRFTVEATGFRRTTQNLMSLVNEGVPFSAYTPVKAMDWGQDAIAFTADDRPITVYNQKFDTLGKDRYLLTNPRGFSAHSEGFELRLRFASQRAQWEATVTRYRSVAATAPGASADQNDTSAFAGVFDDPNKTIFARGSTFFDRGTLGRFRATVEMPWKLRASLIGSYQDGLPYSRLIVVEGLNQGVIGVRTAQRGPGEAGSRVGSMTQHYETLDMRLSRSFALKKGRLTATLDAFNLRNLALATVEGDVTSATEKWRFPIRFQTPRSLQLGLRFDW